MNKKDREWNISGIHTPPYDPERILNPIAYDLDLLPLDPKPRQRCNVATPKWIDKLHIFASLPVLLSIIPQNSKYSQIPKQ